MRTRIKICGLTKAQDARWAVDAGADALGVILHADSPRQVGLDAAEKIFSAVPPFVARVGVFVDAPERVVRLAVDRLRLDCVQFHGEERPEICATAPARVIKAFRVGPDFSAATVEPYLEAVDAMLLDSFDPHRHGGTGVVFPWRIADGLSERFALVLSGGLNPINVRDAILTAKPFAVDVCSGVESSIGVKDRDTIGDFCEAVRRADVERAKR
ncbi:MAG: phosphoribosylanthranilate isomerase [Actinobacteria bacterium]|nr:phosphoribosylanthranilate isomerase [Actinomycetota bacterium]